MKLKVKQNINIYDAKEYCNFLRTTLVGSCYLDDREKEVVEVIRAISHAVLETALDMCESATKKFRVGIETTDEVFEVEAVTEDEAKQKAFDLLMQSKHSSETKIIK